MLLLGPTGAGKTPLGDYLQRHGLGGRRCLHFDFGAHLRRVVESPQDYPSLDAAAVAVVRRVLAEGALLEDREFHVARAILSDFLNACRPGPRDLVVLNGLPRHEGQARDIESLVEVERVACLECEARTVRRRLLADAGGDRGGRGDDTAGLVARKLAWYRRRTRPLLDHYRRRGVHIAAVPVRGDTQPKELARGLLAAPLRRGV